MKLDECPVKVLSAAFVAAAAVFVVCSVFAPGDEKVMMCINRYRNIPFFLVTSILGSFATLVLAMLISRLKSGKRLILYIGTSTLGILLIHKAIMQVIEDVLTKAGINVESLAVSLAYTVPIVILTLIVVRFFDIFCPAIIGKKK